MSSWKSKNGTHVFAYFKKWKDLPDNNSKEYNLDLVRGKLLELDAWIMDYFCLLLLEKLPVSFHVHIDSKISDIL